MKGSTQWANVAIVENGRSGHVALSAGVASGAGASFGFRRSEQSAMLIEQRQGPPDFDVFRTGSGRHHEGRHHEGRHHEERHERHERHERRESPPQGQCFFISYYKIKKRVWWRGMRIQASGEPQDSGHEDGPMGSPCIPAAEGMGEYEVVEGPEEQKVCVTF